MKCYCIFIYHTLQYVLVLYLAIFRGGERNPVVPPPLSVLTPACVHYISDIYYFSDSGIFHGVNSYLCRSSTITISLHNTRIEPLTCMLNSTCTICVIISRKEGRGCVHQHNIVIHVLCACTFVLFMIHTCGR